MEKPELKLLTENRYFEIVDKTQTIGVEYLKGVPQALVEDLMSKTMIRVASGENVMFYEIDEDLFRLQEDHNCFSSVGLVSPDPINPSGAFGLTKVGRK